MEGHGSHVLTIGLPVSPGVRLIVAFHRGSPATSAMVSTEGPPHLVRACDVVCGTRAVGYRMRGKKYMNSTPEGVVCPVFSALKHSTDPPEGPTE